MEGLSALKGNGAKGKTCQRLNKPDSVWRRGINQLYEPKSTNENKRI
tara:strand:+ start:26289 stop:26429 length:141 start_codon:yes stop_codon:yes gene_type:complete